MSNTTTTATAFTFDARTASLARLKREVYFLSSVDMPTVAELKQTFPSFRSADFRKKSTWVALCEYLQTHHVWEALEAWDAYREQLYEITLEEEIIAPTPISEPDPTPVPAPVITPVVETVETAEDLRASLAARLAFLRRPLEVD